MKAKLSSALVVWLLFLFTHFTFAISKTLPQLTIKSIICPNSCRGENTYKIAFDAQNGTVSASRGTVVGDTITGVVAQNYQLTLTVTGTNNDTLVQTIDLPVCDPIFPLAPIGASQLVCGDGPFPALTVFAPTPNSTVDWFDAPVAGKNIATNTLSFQPAFAGVFYAQARLNDSGCVSFSRTGISLTNTRALCPIVTTRKITIQ
ncbi:MAG: hypothetical protein EAZ80_14040 [Runella slithyformis]|nr:MAG: hypothetical protein EAZ80_14040 [Runella slithyformis]TAF45066.1 MAG: hypothetical protein EAZ63_11460 [Runella slithyformis]